MPQHRRLLQTSLMPSPRCCCIISQLYISTAGSSHTGGVVRQPETHSLAPSHTRCHSKLRHIQVTEYMLHAVRWTIWWWRHFQTNYTSVHALWLLYCSLQFHNHSMTILLLLNYLWNVRDDTQQYKILPPPDLQKCSLTSSFTSLDK